MTTKKAAHWIAWTGAALLAAYWLNEEREIQLGLSYGMGLAHGAGESDDIYRFSCSGFGHCIGRYLGRYWKVALALGLLVGAGLRPPWKGAGS